MSNPPSLKEMPTTGSQAGIPAVTQTEAQAAPPATVDIPIDFARRFGTVVVKELDQRSKEAIEKQEDPESMSDYAVKTLRTAIFKAVSGMLVTVFFYIHSTQKTFTS